MVTSTNTSWKSVYKVGGWAAIMGVALGVLEIALTALPDGYASPKSVLDWYALFERNPFMGLRNLGLVNIFLGVSGLLLAFALYAAHREVDAPYATLALILSVLGSAIFYSTNRAFTMLSLSQLYAAAPDGQRAVLEAAGQAALSVGQSHTAGTFLAFFTMEAASLVMSWVMLRNRVFSRAAAWFGILAFSFLMLYDICVSFIPALWNPALVLALIGGISSMVWYVMIAIQFFRMAKGKR